MLKEKKIKEITNTNINFLGAFLCLFVLFQSPSKVKSAMLALRKLEALRQQRKL